MGAQALIFALVFAITALCLGQDQHTSASGIEGVITIGPIRPGPIRRDSEYPTRAPFASTTFTVRNENAAVASFTTDEQGRFRVLVPPGHYTVALQEPRSGPGHYGPFTAEVVAGKMTRVEWGCDSGMR